MNGAQKAIIPGILLSSMLLVLLNRFVNPIHFANAAAEAPQQKGEERSEPVQACPDRGRYPEAIAPWCELIEEQTSGHDLDPLLVAAVMLVESGGQPAVISHSGAVGLMQVMPRDGIAASFQCINGPCFSGRPTIEELKNPDFNVEYGIHMLVNLAARYGNLRDALKAYGPGDVGYWYADKVLANYSGF